MKLEMSSAYFDDEVSSALGLMPKDLSQKDQLAFLEFVNTSRTLQNDPFDGSVDLGSVREFYLASPNRDDLLVPEATIAVPIGAYGEQFWFDLVRATRNLALVAKDTLGEQALNLKRLQPEIMATTLVDTLRFRDSLLEEYNTPLANLHEGILALADSIWLSMAENNGGPDDPLEYL